MRQRPPVFLPNFVHKSKLFSCPFPSSLSLGWAQSKFNDACPIFACPLLPSRPRPNFPTHPYSKRRKIQHICSLCWVLAKWPKSFLFLLTFTIDPIHHPRERKSRPLGRAAESKVQLVSKWKMSFRKFLIAAAAAIGVKGALPAV